jgi:hypothetical protein
VMTAKSELHEGGNEEENTRRVSDGASSR